jgi:hypothetical protein
MGDGKLSEISQLLAIVVDMDGLPRQGYTEEAIGDLEYRLWYEFAESDIGQELAARCGPGIADRVKRIYDERNVGRSYATVDAFDELQKIGTDLLVDLPEPEEPRPIPQPARPLTPEEEHARLVQQVRDDIANPAITAASINARRRSNPTYELAFRDANTPDAAPVEKVVGVSAEAKKFAHLYNDALLNHGISSLKPRSGVVTVRVGAGANAKAYEYPSHEANRLLEECCHHGLIR